jgi:DNA-binding transcriptional MerR regulator
MNPLSARPLSVRDAADQTGVSVYTLHYYEREGLLQTARTQSGHRRYAESDLGWIRILTCLRQTGMPIRKMREFAELVRQDQTNIPADTLANVSANIEARIGMLEAHRVDVLAHIAELGRNLEHVEGKIRHYRQALQDEPGQIQLGLVPRARW